MGFLIYIVMNEGWIKLHRQILNWEWWSDIKTYRLFTYLLLASNYEDKSWRGVDIKRGDILTSIESLVKSTNLTQQEVRTSLKRLKSTGEITTKTTNKYTTITICNYDIYQINIDDTNKQTNKQDNKQLTNKQQTTNKQLTTTKEIKKRRIKELEEEKNKNINNENFLKNENISLPKTVNRGKPINPDKEYKPTSEFNPNTDDIDLILADKKTPALENKIKTEANYTYEKFMSVYPRKTKDRNVIVSEWQKLQWYIKKFIIDSAIENYHKSLENKQFMASPEDFLTLKIWDNRNFGDNIHYPDRCHKQSENWETLEKLFRENGLPKFERIPTL
jgi:hypothetical protein